MGQKGQKQSKSYCKITKESQSKKSPILCLSRECQSISSPSLHSPATETITHPPQNDPVCQLRKQAELWFSLTVLASIKCLFKMISKTRNIFLICKFPYCSGKFRKESLICSPAGWNHTSAPKPLHSLATPTYFTRKRKPVLVIWSAKSGLSHMHSDANLYIRTGKSKWLPRWSNSEWRTQRNLD